MDSVIGLISDFGILHLQWGQFLMIVIGMILLYLAIVKGFEPLLLVPIGLGGILSNLPDANLAINAVDAAIHAGKADVMQAFAQILNVVESTPDAIKHALQMATPEQKMHLGLLAEQYQYSDGMLYTFYHVAIASGVGPLVIFMGVGAMTDFGPLLANPKTLLLGAAAQFGIFATVLGALGLSQLGIMDFTVAQAAAIGIIGGADGPTAIYVSSLLAPELLGAIAVAAYSYMALVPMIQPPIMRALTTEAERKIEMKQLRKIGKIEKVCFPLMLLVLIAMLLPSATPLMGMFCFGNLMRECGVVERLSDTAQNALINIVTIFLGLSVGSKLMADKFLQPQTLGILALGIVAFCVGTAAGLLMAKLMNRLCVEKVNPLIGSAGVSAVPMAARVSNKLGLEANSQNFLLMHAMGPNVAGVIGSAVAAGVMIKYVLG
ncbi:MULTISPECIES: sodium ion-translocating decarboxylase subunit beta [Vibrio]|jgi:oxaloacetate decarboxylase beta subunit|uniref:Oxaloacetate decarboxylase beta chain n=2 Tax=Gammaproteobacteria TaxID=1236 RepID=A0A2J8G9E2_VIBDI|nr:MULTISPECIES: sodium ion-translocating decarboxylase subunit beta [Vibrio]MCF7360643.1 sodium ion-translocating decarboxylase subunit beta [Vibrio sp. A1-b2]MCZ4371114.1 sodium ion-translocating decarboxylase subunit beta [Vibrio diazotrophicus]PNH82626.1 sodium ion-translocating decarboxylase subunit beta [Vibrio diazotrophicus]PNH94919.1 sodium ion-translocating decarboxylase subunit beta [Vibrio diazotrophicus]PNH99152.1 sodium ion-translocating decarboxylase subunit beta [Vibrio diazotr